MMADNQTGSALNTEGTMYSPMTPIKAFAWTAAYVLAGSFYFWSESSFGKAPYRHWSTDLFYLCLFVPLSWFVYRSYRKGSGHPFFENIPRSQKRGMQIVGVVIFTCVATLEIVLASLKVSDGRLHHFATASVWLVLGADSWRRYLELKEPEVSSAY
jgi:hypothetical protein